MHNTIIFFTLLISTVSCQPKVRTAIPSPDKDYAAENYTAATVRDYRKLDGCKFLLETDKHTFITPENLDSTLQVEGQKVWVKYTPLKNVMSICMKGKMVRIIDFEIRK